MKTIQSIQIWKNGAAKQASVITARIINDDLNTSCTFYYELKEADVITPSEVEGEPDTILYGERLAEGNITMSGTDYENWDGSNDVAYQHIATSLNLTMVTGSI